ncbi:MAG TPA: hypothetical protein DHW42_10350 [Candidatus Marinimicrobia bacterium]|nr:hypothetical protein [Candidatus Neomarinimicrobiota bacterium]
MGWYYRICKIEILTQPLPYTGQVYSNNRIRSRNIWCITETEITRITTEVSRKICAKKNRGLL